MYLICPNGHRWVPSGAVDGEAAPACPTCGSPGDPHEFDEMPQSTLLVDPDAPARNLRHRPSTTSLPWLSRCQPFFSLPTDLVERVEQNMGALACPEGELLLRQGEIGDALLVITEGRVEISTRDELDGQRRVIGTVGPGELLGEMAVLTDEPRTADARALSPVKARILPVDRFHDLARRHPILGVVLTELLSSRLGGEQGDVLEGKTLGGYRLGKLLGRGGMGAVYAGIDDGGERVALKMLHHRLVYDTSALAQFQREAAIIQLFQHEHIVRMFGTFHAFHTYFIAMELCQGRTLDWVIRHHGPIPEPECRKLLGQLATVLSYAHSRDVVHRDVKPSNIMLGPQGQLKLMDFGLARPLLETDSNLDRLIVGTPGYMAPEQFLGEPITDRADYFSLGCVLYEMLAGERLFPDIDVATLLSEHAARRRPPLDRLPSSVSRDLRAILEASLSPSPPDRRIDLDLLGGDAGPVSTEFLRE